MKRIAAVIFAGLLLAGCADTSGCAGGAVYTANGVVCAGPGHG